MDFSNFFQTLGKPQSIPQSILGQVQGFLKQMQTAKFQQEQPKPDRPVVASSPSGFQQVSATKVDTSKSPILNPQFTPQKTAKPQVTPNTTTPTLGPTTLSGGTQEPNWWDRFLSSQKQGAETIQNFGAGLTTDKIAKLSPIADRPWYEKAAWALGTGGLSLTPDVAQMAVNIPGGVITSFGGIPRALVGGAESTSLGNPLDIAKGVTGIGTPDQSTFFGNIGRGGADLANVAMTSELAGAGAEHLMTKPAKVSTDEIAAFLMGKGAAIRPEAQRVMMEFAQSEGQAGLAGLKDAVIEMGPGKIIDVGGSTSRVARGPISSALTGRPEGTTPDFLSQRKIGTGEQGLTTMPKPMPPPAEPMAGVPPETTSLAQIPARAASVPPEPTKVRELKWKRNAEDASAALAKAEEQAQETLATQETPAWKAQTETGDVADAVRTETGESGNRKLFADTGKKIAPMTLYHGTSSPIQYGADPITVSDGGAYGPGLYLTDKPNEASFFAERDKKLGVDKRAPVVHIGKISSNNILDLDAPAPDSLRRYVANYFESNNIFADEDRLRSMLNRIGSDGYTSGDAFRDVQINSQGWDRDGAARNLSKFIRDSGYDLLTHENTLASGGRRDYILLRPLEKSELGTQPKVEIPPNALKSEKKTTNFVAPTEFVTDSAAKAKVMRQALGVENAPTDKNLGPNSPEDLNMNTSRLRGEDYPQVMSLAREQMNKLVETGQLTGEQATDLYKMVAGSDNPYTYLSRISTAAKDSGAFLSAGTGPIVGTRPGEAGLGLYDILKHEFTHQASRITSSEVRPITTDFQFGALTEKGKPGLAKVADAYQEANPGTPRDVAEERASNIFLPQEHTATAAEMYKGDWWKRVALEPRNSSDPVSVIVHDYFPVVDRLYGRPNQVQLYRQAMGAENVKSMDGIEAKAGSMSASLSSPLFDSSGNYTGGRLPPGNKNPYDPKDPRYLEEVPVPKDADAPPYDPKELERQTVSHEEAIPMIKTGIENYIQNYPLQEQLHAAVFDGQPHSTADIPDRVMEAVFGGTDFLWGKPGAPKKIELPTERQLYGQAAKKAEDEAGVNYPPANREKGMGNKVFGRPFQRAVTEFTQLADLDPALYDLTAHGQLARRDFREMLLGVSDNLFKGIQESSGLTTKQFEAKYGDGTDMAKMIHRASINWEGGETNAAAKDADIELLRGDPVAQRLVDAYRTLAEVDLILKSRLNPYDFGIQQHYISAESLIARNPSVEQQIVEGEDSLQRLADLANSQAELDQLQKNLAFDPSTKKRFAEDQPVDGRLQERLRRSLGRVARTYARPYFDAAARRVLTLPENVQAPAAKVVLSAAGKGYKPTAVNNLLQYARSWGTYLRAPFGIDYIRTILGTIRSGGGTAKVLGEFAKAFASKDGWVNFVTHSVYGAPQPIKNLAKKIGAQVDKAGELDLTGSLNPSELDPSRFDHYPEEERGWAKALHIATQINRMAANTLLSPANLASSMANTASRKTFEALADKLGYKGHDKEVFVERKMSQSDTSLMGMNLSPAQVSEGKRTLWQYVAPRQSERIRIWKTGSAVFRDLDEAKMKQEKIDELKADEDPDNKPANDAEIKKLEGEVKAHMDSAKKGGKAAMAYLIASVLAVELLRRAWLNGKAIRGNTTADDFVPVVPQGLLQSIVNEAQQVKMGNEGAVSGIVNSATNAVRAGVEEFMSPSSKFVYNSIFNAKTLSDETYNAGLTGRQIAGQTFYQTNPVTGPLIGAARFVTRLPWGLGESTSQAIRTSSLGRMLPKEIGRLLKSPADPTVMAQQQRSWSLKESVKADMGANAQGIRDWVQEELTTNGTTDPKALYEKAVAEGVVDKKDMREKYALLYGLNTAIMEEKAANTTDPNRAGWSVLLNASFAYSNPQEQALLILDHYNSLPEGDRATFVQQIQDSYITNPRKIGLVSGSNMDAAARLRIALRKGLPAKSVGAYPEQPLAGIKELQ